MSVEPVGSSLIDFAEAAYDLTQDRDEWLRKLLRAGAPVLDHGLGVFALTCYRPPEAGPLMIDAIHVESGHEALAARVGQLQREVPPTVLWPLSQPSMPRTLSEAAGDDFEALNFVMRYFDFAKDGLGISAFDPSGRGVFIIAPLPKVSSLNERARERGQMLAAHFRAGDRLRRARTDSASLQTTDLPLGAEVVIDPAGFRVADARGKASAKDARTALRDAAVKVDEIRGSMRESNPEEALELWAALVRGRWSTVDWFDSDGRRFVLGLPNAPNVTDPRGLTERELQVVSYAVLGQTNKLIAYQLGLSKGRVSTLISSAMRKLGAQTRAQLIKKLRDFGSVTGA